MSISKLFRVETFVHPSGRKDWRLVRRPPTRDPRRQTRDTIIGVERGTAIDPGVIFNGMASGLDSLPEETRRDVVARLVEKYLPANWRTDAVGSSSPTSDAARHYRAFHGAKSTGYAMQAYGDMLRAAAERNFPR